MGHDYLKEQQLQLDDPLVAKNVKRILDEVALILRHSGVLLDYPRTISKEKVLSVWNNRRFWRRKWFYLKDAFLKLSAKRRGFPCRFATNTYYLWPDGHLKGCPADALKTENLFNSNTTLEKEMARVQQVFSKKFLDACHTCSFHLE